VRAASWRAGLALVQADGAVTGATPEVVATILAPARAGHGAPERHGSWIWRPTFDGGEPDTRPGGCERRNGRLGELGTDGRDIDLIP
jgi:hypothetical protein